MATDSDNKKNSAQNVPNVTGEAEVISLKDKGLNEIPIPSALSLRKRSNEYSHISNPRTVTLYTDEAIHVFEHEFRVADFALRRLFYNYVTIDDPVLSKAWETAVFNRLKEFFDGLKSAFVEMQSRFKEALENPENNLDHKFLGDFYFLAEKYTVNDKTETDNPKTFELSQSNPDIMYFLYCLKLYDRFGCLLRQVVNAHAISSSSYATIMQVWAREFQKVVRDIKVFRQETEEKIRDKQFLQQTEEAKRVDREIKRHRKERQMGQRNRFENFIKKEDERKKKPGALEAAQQPKNDKASQKGKTQPVKADKKAKPVQEKAPTAVKQEASKPKVEAKKASEKTDKAKSQTTQPSQQKDKPKETVKNPPKKPQTKETPKKKEQTAKQTIEVQPKKEEPPKEQVAVSGPKETEPKK